MRRHLWPIWLATGLAGLVGYAAPELQTRLVYKDHVDFVRLSEFFNGREDSSGRAIVRSQPKSRTGLYFSLNISGSVGQLPEGAKVLLDLVHPKSPEVKAFELIAPRTPDNSREMLVGLTGDDWTRTKGKPVAWRIRILDVSGGVLAAEQSFLWEEPKVVSASP
jgi:hypothetical protein